MNRLGDLATWYLAKNIPMTDPWGLVYLPTWMVDFDSKCRLIDQSHGYPGIFQITGDHSSTVELLEFAVSPIIKLETAVSFRGACVESKWLTSLMGLNKLQCCVKPWHWSIWILGCCHPFQKKCKNSFRRILNPTTTKKRSKSANNPFFWGGTSKGGSLTTPTSTRDFDDLWRLTLTENNGLPNLVLPSRFRQKIPMWDEELPTNRLGER